MTGQFFKSGSSVVTNFDETPKGASELINNFYTEGWQAFVNHSFAKSAGAPGYNTVGADGMFNPKYGKDLTALMFSSVAVSSAIGKRAYQNEGMRLIPSQATVGTASDFVRNGTAVFKDKASNGYDSNYFLGLGAGTTHDGYIMDSVQMPVDEIRVPYKELPFSYNYGLALKIIESKDDVASYNMYMGQMASNYNDLLDKTLLRPLANEQPKVSKMAGTSLSYTQDKETGLNGLARVMSSGEEIGKVYKDNTGADITITEDHVSPWGGTSGDLAAMRGLNDGTGKTHISNNYDANVVDANKGLLTVGLLDSLHMMCMQGWDTISPEGKFWVMSPVMWNKVSQLKAANNIFENSVFTTMSVGGVKTIEGREGGFMLNSYRNLPIITSGNASFNYSTKKVDFVNAGEISLIDGAHVWISLLSPMQVTTLENIAITRDLKEHNVMLMRAELRADKFIGSGRITNIATE